MGKSPKNLGISMGSTSSILFYLDTLAFLDSYLGIEVSGVRVKVYRGESTVFLRGNVAIFVWDVAVLMVLFVRRGAPLG